MSKIESSINNIKSDVNTVRVGLETRTVLIEF